ncbi:cell division protein ZapA [uncultured Desulfuromusa sp.]|uniref:cell division protein ZapA n=1 Tax=uncultured Desulfuromusa sp. TaxID=219183 RepID=UPI002AA95A36|nr:cell division protein ZapA [uncultured Desulfuromusa sp.]
MNSNIKVTILGREYKLRSQESEDQIQRVVDFIEEKLAETASGRSVDTRDLTVLTLLNLAGQYLQLSDVQNQDGEQYEKRMQQLIESLERAVADNSGC